MEHFSLVDDSFSNEDKLKYEKQRKERGFDDTELWNLDCTIVKFVIPRLEAFISLDNNSYPTCIKNDYPNKTFEEYCTIWHEEILPNMLKGLKDFVNDGDKPSLDLFFKYFRCLWT